MMDGWGGWVGGWVDVRVRLCARVCGLGGWVGQAGTGDELLSLFRTFVIDAWARGSDRTCCPNAGAVAERRRERRASPMRLAFMAGRGGVGWSVRASVCCVCVHGVERGKKKQEEEEMCGEEGGNRSSVNVRTRFDSIRFDSIRFDQLDVRRPILACLGPPTLAHDLARRATKLGFDQCLEIQLLARRRPKDKNKRRRESDPSDPSSRLGRSIQRGFKLGGAKQVAAAVMAHAERRSARS